MGIVRWMDYKGSDIVKFGCFILFLYILYIYCILNIGEYFF